MTSSILSFWWNFAESTPNIYFSFLESVENFLTVKINPLTHNGKPRFTTTPCHPQNMLPVIFARGKSKIGKIHTQFHCFSSYRNMNPLLFPGRTFPIKLLFNFPISSHVFLPPQKLRHMIMFRWLFFVRPSNWLVYKIFSSHATFVYTRILHLTKP